MAMINQIGTDGLPAAITQAQQSTFNVGTDTGVADAYVVALTPAITGTPDFFWVIFTPANANATQLPTLDAGNGAKSILLSGGANVGIDDMDGSVQQAICYYDPVEDAYFLLNPCNSLNPLITPPQIQNQIFTVSTDGGVADAYVGDYSPAITGYNGGMQLTLTDILQPNTGAPCTFNAGGGPLAVINKDGTPIYKNQILANSIYTFNYSDQYNAWILSAGVTATQVQQNIFNNGVDSGIADAYDIAIYGGITTPTDGMFLVFTPANTNVTNTPTVALNGGTPIDVNLSGGVAPSPGDFQENYGVVLEYTQSAAVWVMVSTPFSLTRLAFNSVLGTLTTYADTGTTNNLVIASTAPYFPYGYPVGEGTQINVIPANTNTDSAVINITSYGDAPITYADGTPLAPGAMVAGTIYYLFNNSTVSGGFPGNWVVLNPTVINTVISKQILTPTNAATIDLTNAPNLTILNPSGTLTALTINMSSSPFDSQIQKVSTTNVITALTVGGNGNSIVGQPTTLAVGSDFSMIYDLATTTWYPA